MLCNSTCCVTEQVFGFASKRGTSPLLTCLPGDASRLRGTWGAATVVLRSDSSWVQTCTSGSSGCFLELKPLVILLSINNHKPNTEWQEARPLSSVSPGVLMGFSFYKAEKSHVSLFRHGFVRFNKLFRPLFCFFIAQRRWGTISHSMGKWWIVSSWRTKLQISQEALALSNSKTPIVCGRCWRQSHTISTEETWVF